MTVNKMVWFDPLKCSIETMHQTQNNLLNVMNLCMYIYIANYVCNYVYQICGYHTWKFYVPHNWRFWGIKVSRCSWISTYPWNKTFEIWFKVVICETTCTSSLWIFAKNWNEVISRNLFTQRFPAIQYNYVGVFFVSMHQI